jgi:hypothetical protein
LRARLEPSKTAEYSKSGYLNPLLLAIKNAAKPEGKAAIRF